MQVEMICACYFKCQTKFLSAFSILKKLKPSLSAWVGVTEMLLYEITQLNLDKVSYCGVSEL